MKRYIYMPRHVLATVACLLVLLPLQALADTVLITGANSGIGLEFAKQYAARGWSVIATHRRDSTPDTLKALMQEHKNVRVEKMDVTDRAQVDALAQKLAGTPIDVLINNAGVFVLGGANGQWNNAGAHYDGQIFGTLDYQQFETFMKTNVAGPAMVTEAFAPLVKPAVRKRSCRSAPRTGRSRASPCAAASSGIAPARRRSTSS